MVRFISILSAILITAISSTASPDGKFYSAEGIENVPVATPYQRAMIAYKYGQEFLIVQSAFEGKTSDLGWVVPVPNPPKFNLIREGTANGLFYLLDGATAPQSRSILWFVFRPIFILYLFVSPLLCVCSIFFSVYHLFRRTKNPRMFFLPLKPGLYFLVSLPAWLFIFFMAHGALNTLSSSKLTSANTDRVEVIDKQKVGIYDVTVIKGESSSAIIDWLNDHHYHFTESDRVVFDSYVQKGWCFVTARVSTEKIGNDELKMRDGLVDPLIMSFQSSEIVYPLALTATAGKNTVVLIYVIADKKVVADQRFKMTAAVDADSSDDPGLRIIIAELEDMIDSELDRNGSDGPYKNIITKFKATLSADQMSQDAVFKPASDDKLFKPPMEWHLF